TERTGLRLARRMDKPLFVLRLGHVGGLLQGISQQMRAALADDSVLLPARDVASNLVYTVTIVDAIRRIAAGQVTPGIHDLMCVPQCSWREVHAAERDIAGRPDPGLRSAAATVTARPTPLRTVVRGAARLLVNEGTRNTIAKFMAHAPPDFNARAHAWWHVAR